MMFQEEYIKQIADKNYKKFFSQGRADAGHNGPHGHTDSPVRNTSHFLIIYSYLYKTTKNEKYYIICEKFANYLLKKAKESRSGAIECMTTDKFDHLNGLIGQGWVIEALLYYYDISKDERCLRTARQIFYAQKYDFKLHLWHRIELDGRDIGIDPTYNHNIWFAACASKLLDYSDDSQLKSIIEDLLSHGTERDFRIYKNGMLHHSVVLADEMIKYHKLKKIIKLFLYPVRFLYPRKLDYKYMEKSYHIFDMYGFCILEEKFSYLPFFSSQKYIKARDLALNYKEINRLCGYYGKNDKRNKGFNVFYYSYNSPIFEFPYISEHFGESDVTIYSELVNIQKHLMYCERTQDFSNNNPDLITFQARSYELIRYLDLIHQKQKD